MVMEEIVSDIRREFEDMDTPPSLEPSYAEARMPDVPTMLLELLSIKTSQICATGWIPLSAFTVSRSIYKGMLRFLANQYNRPYVVQPLPVKESDTRFSGDTEVELKWQPSPIPRNRQPLPPRI
jgi:hypothetical protein